MERRPCCGGAKEGGKKKEETRQAVHTKGIRCRATVSSKKGGEGAARVTWVTPQIVPCEKNGRRESQRESQPESSETSRKVGLPDAGRCSVPGVGGI